MEGKIDMGNTYIEDIFSQPDSLKKCADMLGKQTKTVLDIKNKEYRKIIFTGMGSSNYCSMTAERYLIEQGWSSVRYSTAELLRSYFDVIQEDTLLVMISQSGESGEIVKLLEKLSPQICVVGITNNPESTLAKKSTYSLFMNVDMEQSVTTRTYMAGMAVTLFMAMSLSGISYEKFLKGLLKCIQNMRIILKESIKWKEKVEEFPDMTDSVWFLGRGIDYGTALAGTLFFREVSRVMSIAEYCGEFRHGPFEVVDSCFLAILITTDKEVYKLNQNLLKNIRKKGGHVLVISDQNEEEPAIVLPTCDKWYSQFLTIVPIQILADCTAKRKGIEAGTFRWGSKITKGE